MTKLWFKTILSVWVIYWSYSTDEFETKLNTLTFEQVRDSKIKFPSYYSGYHEIIYWRRVHND